VIRASIGTVGHAVCRRMRVAVPGMVTVSLRSGNAESLSCVVPSSRAPRGECRGRNKWPGAAATAWQPLAPEVAGLRLCGARLMLGTIWTREVDHIRLMPAQRLAVCLGSL
jgi:hypothetical protein